MDTICVGLPFCVSFFSLLNYAFDTILFISKLVRNRRNVLMTIRCRIKITACVYLNDFIFNFKFFSMTLLVVSIFSSFVLVSVCVCVVHTVFQQAIHKPNATAAIKTKTTTRQHINIIC